MVQQIINFFSKKTKIKSGKGFANIKDYIHNQIYETKNRVINIGYNNKTFLIKRISFHIKNIIGYYGTKKRMIKFIDDLVFIEVVHENNQDMQEIYFRVKEEALNLLKTKTDRGKLFLRLTEYLFFAILISFFLFFFAKNHPSVYFRIISYLFISFTTIFYFLPMMLISFRNRTYSTFSYYLKKESEEIDKPIGYKLLDHDLIYAFGILFISKELKYIKEKKQKIVTHFYQRLKVDLSDKSVENYLFNKYLVPALNNKIKILERLYRIKLIASEYIKSDQPDKTDDFSFLKTSFKINFIFDQLKENKIIEQGSYKDLKNILKLFTSSYKFKNKEEIDLLSFYSKNELENICTKILAIINNYNSEIKDKKFKFDKDKFKQDLIFTDNK